MRSYLISILAGLPILARSTLALASRDEVPDFKAIFSPVLSSGAHLYLPGDPEYFKVNERWSNLEDPQYVAAIQPATELDVKNIVSCSSYWHHSSVSTDSFLASLRFQRPRSIISPFSPPGQVTVSNQAMLLLKEL